VLVGAGTVLSPEQARAAAAAGASFAVAPRQRRGGDRRVLACGGSWIADKALLAARRFEVTRRARAAVELTA
jgi:2-keto-3-deoxy-6-phosphogluconate aldolase